MLHSGGGRASDDLFNPLAPTPPGAMSHELIARSLGTPRTPAAFCCTVSTLAHEATSAEPMVASPNLLPRQVLY
jgi:hypothetical protein